MNNLDFLKGLLSDSGHYCVFAAKGDVRIQKFYATIEDAESTITIKNPKTKVESEVTLTGLNDFFV